MYNDHTKNAAIPAAIIYSRLDLFRPNNCELRFLGTKSWRPRGSAKVFTSFSSGHRFPPCGRLGKDHFHPHEMRCSQKLFLNVA